MAPTGPLQGSSGNQMQQLPALTTSSSHEGGLDLVKARGKKGSMRGRFQDLTGTIKGSIKKRMSRENVKLGRSSISTDDESREREQPMAWRKSISSLTSSLRGTRASMDSRRSYDNPRRSITLSYDAASPTSSNPPPLPKRRTSLSQLSEASSQNDSIPRLPGLNEMVALATKKGQGLQRVPLGGPEDGTGIFKKLDLAPFERGSDDIVEPISESQTETDTKQDILAPTRLPLRLKNHSKPTTAKPSSNAAVLEPATAQLDKPQPEADVPEFSASKLDSVFRTFLASEAVEPCTLCASHHPNLYRLYKKIMPYLTCPSRPIDGTPESSIQERTEDVASRPASRPASPTASRPAEDLSWWNGWGIIGRGRTSAQLSEELGEAIRLWEAVPLPDREMRQVLDKYHASEPALPADAPNDDLQAEHMRNCYAYIFLMRELGSDSYHPDRFHPTTVATDAEPWEKEKNRIQNCYAYIAYQLELALCVPPPAPPNFAQFYLDEQAGRVPVWEFFPPEPDATPTMGIPADEYEALHQHDEDRRDDDGQDQEDGEDGAYGEDGEYEVDYQYGEDEEERRRWRV
ncbi:hypothetical protein F4778DRAFT_553773 [Xylariomycetidae sp. FL2044]|nr:hypothetical protein F4778DRAFT_553773 [Xylariomycetidae sp. FL2044]